MIKVTNLTLKYPNGKGIFDLNFNVKKGEVIGYLGPNGAGKTTTIRALMGFMNADNGSCLINNLNCFSDSSKIQKTVGYIPGEISFIEGMSGDEYLKFISEMRGTKDLTLLNNLIEMFEFSPKGKIKKFSKGMKQKLSIVSAFMHNPDVLILDEPTSGLDPLMQSRFVDLILTEKSKGKTILMSSHIFEEIERTCDNVLIIKDGKIITQTDITTLKNNQRKCFKLKTSNPKQTIELLQNANFKLGLISGNEVEVYVTGENIDRFGKILHNFTLLGLDTKTQSLEDIFMHYYSKEVK